MRAVVDTNVLVSRLLTPHGRASEVFDAWERGRFELVASEPILEEYGAVLRYGRIRSRHGLGDAMIDEFIDGFRDVATVTPVESVELPDIHLEDSSDVKLLECAVASGAECVVSGDGHLLVVGKYGDVQVVTPAAFLLVLNV